MSLPIAHAPVASAVPVVNGKPRAGAARYE